MFDALFAKATLPPALSTPRLETSVSAPSPALSHAASSGTSSASAQIVLHAYDTSGNSLSWSAFKSLQENGAGSNGDDDALLDPATLQVIQISPLYDSGNNPALTLPGRAAALSLAWPTSDGYSNLIINLPNTGGTYNFDMLAAQQVVSDLAKAQAERPWYVPSAAESSAAQKAASLLTAARNAATDSKQGALAAQALDSAVHAEMLLLQESGSQNGAVTKNAQWGVTLDDISQGQAELKEVQSLYGGNGWVRIVFDKGEPASYYAAEVAGAHKLGLKVLGELLDSSDMASTSVSAFEQRVQQYVSTLPTVDEWEVGNEVNGNWLGSTSSVVQKTEYAAQYVKQHTGARTLVTLYWQLGEDTASDSMFNWAASNLPPILPYVDDIGISLYPGEAPMGAAFDRVMTTLHNQFPNQKLMVTELGYGTVGNDTEGGSWWWGSPTDQSATGAGASAVAELYQSAVMSFPFSGGGTYWWYFVETAQPGNPIWNALSASYKQAQS